MTNNVWAAVFDEWEIVLKLFWTTSIDLHHSTDVTYKSRGQGAFLFLPHDGDHKYVIRFKVFEDCIRDNVARWFTWSQKNGLLV